MSSVSRCCRICSRSTPNSDGSTVIHVSQLVGSPSGATGMNSMPVDTFEKVAVATIDRATACDLLVEILQLTSPDRRQQVAEPVVVADVAVLIVRRGVARLRGEMSHPRDVRRVVGHERCRHHRR